MYTNSKDITKNELVIVHYGNIVTIKGSQIIINGQPGPQLPHKINDLLIRQATSVLVGVEGKDFFNTDEMFIFFSFFLIKLSIGFYNLFRWISCLYYIGLIFSQSNTWSMWYIQLYYTR